MAENNSINRVFIGGGAVGCFLAQDFSQPLPSPGTFRDGPLEPGVQHRMWTNTLLLVQHLPSHPVKVICEKKVSEIPTSSFAAFSDLKKYKPTFQEPQVDIFVCTPCFATLESLHHFLMHSEFSSKTHINFIFCSNGMLDVNPWAEFHFLSKDLLCRMSCFRALIFAGFMRSFSDTKIEIRHLGGVLVKYAQWPQKDSAEKKIASLVPPHFAHSMQWHRVSDIDVQEFTKFFVNMSLAMTLGPLPIVNACLKSQLSAQAAYDLAEAFLGLRPDINADLFACLDTLWQTIRTTANNVNSLSLAGSEGNSTQFISFWNTVWGWVELSTEVQLKSFWHEKHLEVMKLWGSF